MAEVKINLINDKQLLALFNDLNPQKQKQVIMGGLRQSARIINDQAKLNFQATKKGKSKTDYKGFAEMFTVKAMKDKMGVIVGLSDYEEGYKYRMINYGTESRDYKTKNGIQHNTGKLMGTKFFTDAVEEKKQEAEDNIENCITTNMERLVAKYNK